MKYYLYDAPQRTEFLRAATSLTAAGLISSAHHVYGAIAYETPWRMVVSLWIPAFVLVVLVALFLHWKHGASGIGAVARWFVLLGGVIFQAGFTLFECVYSHVLKIALFYGGASQAILERLYPPPTYHLPDNLLCEATGVAQLTGFWAAWCAWQVFSALSEAD